MHLLLLILLQVFAVLSIGSALVYAPFAKGWLRALLVPAASAFLWTVTRVAIMLAFADPDVPLSSESSSRLSVRSFTPCWRGQ